MTIHAKRMTLAGASVALALTIGVLGVTAAQGDTTLSIPLPSLSDTMIGVVVTVAGFFGKRLFRLLDVIRQQGDETQAEFREFRVKVETTLMGIDGRGGIVDDVRELQREQALMQRPVSPPAGFNIMPQAVAAKEPT